MTQTLVGFRRVGVLDAFGQRNRVSVVVQAFAEIGEPLGNGFPFRQVFVFGAKGPDGAPLKFRNVVGPQIGQGRNRIGDRVRNRSKRARGPSDRYGG